MISELPCGNNFLTRIGGVLQKLSDVLPNATPFLEKTIRRNTGDDGDGGKKNTIEVTFINTSPNVQFSDMFCTTTFGYAIFKRPPFNISSPHRVSINIVVGHSATYILIYYIQLMILKLK